MTKTIGVVLVAALAAPSSVRAQATTGQPAAATVKVSNMLRQSIDREAVRLAKGQSDAPRPAPERNWAGQHPIALGVMIGTAGGAIWGSAQCPHGCDGDASSIALGGALVGAGIGAGVGAIVSLVQHARSHD